MGNISYIIPHYENVKGLKKLIESIVLSVEDEIIVIDDCSRIETMSEIKKLQKKYNFLLIKSDVNKGAGHARNVGMKNSTSEWIIFADADDYFIDSYYKVLEDYRISTDDIIYFTPTSTKISNNNSVRTSRHSYYEKLIFDYIDDNSNENELLYRFVVPWSKMFNRKFLLDNSILFDEIFVSNDVMFSAKSGFYSNNIDATRNVIYCCTESDKSLTANASYESTEVRQDTFIRYTHFLKKNLSKSEFKNLDLVGFSFIVFSIRNNYKLNEIKKIFMRFKDEKVKVISIRYFINTFKRLMEEKWR